LRIGSIKAISQFSSHTREAAMDNNDHPTYYEIFGIPKSASPEQIKSQYRKLAKKHDLNRLKGLQNKYRETNDEDLLKVIEAQIAQETEQMKLINEAYEILSDPDKRRTYDQTLTGGFAATESPHVVPPDITVDKTVIRFGEMTKGQRKYSFFTISNRGGPLVGTIHIDWMTTPGWATPLVIQPDPVNVFPIKVIIQVDTTNTSAGFQSAQIEVTTAGGKVGVVEVMLTVIIPVPKPTPQPIPTYVPPTPQSYAPPPPTRSKNTGYRPVIAMLVVILVGIFYIVIRNFNYASSDDKVTAVVTSAVVGGSQKGFHFTMRIINEAISPKWVWFDYTFRLSNGAICSPLRWQFRSDLPAYGLSSPSEVSGYDYGIYIPTGKTVDLTIEADPHTCDHVMEINSPLTMESCSILIGSSFMSKYGNTSTITKSCMGVT
jgi:hypothetical protein